MAIPPRLPSTELVLRPRAEVVPYRGNVPSQGAEGASAPLSHEDWMHALLIKPFPDLAQKLIDNGYKLHASTTKGSGSAYWSITPSNKPDARILHAFFGPNGEPPPGGVFLREFLERWAGRYDQSDHIRLTHDQVRTKVEAENARAAAGDRLARSQVDGLVADGYTPGAAQAKVDQARAARELNDKVRLLGRYLAKSIVDAHSGEPSLLTTHTSEELARAILTGKLPAPVAEAIQLGQYRIEQTHVDRPQGGIVVRPQQHVIRLEQGHRGDLSQVALDLS